MKMSRNSGNVSKGRKLTSAAGDNSKPCRKSFPKVSESSSVSSNRNSSAQSEEDVKAGGVYSRPQVNKNANLEEQEQLVKKLQGQVKELKHKVRVLEESVDSKDFSLGTIAREKDRAIGEIRRLERSNKQLRQQLSDERNHYLEEKERFVEEMSKYKRRLQDLKALKDGKKINTMLGQALPASKQSLISQSLKWQLNKDKGDFAEAKANPDVKKTKSHKFPRVLDRGSSLLEGLSCRESKIRKAGSLESFHLYEGDDLTLQTAALRTENAKLRSIICERDERNYELCLRFLRMKHTKNDIRSRFQDLENEYLQVIANLMDKIDEARQEFNFIIDQKFKRPLHSTNAMYLQLVQRNSKMAFENASLRLENQCLKKELNKYATGVSEDRKLERTFPGTLEVSKGEGVVKKLKKNVNFKEIRTIYERDIDLRNSDTDSNYMSKTSTTIPSNISLNDPKSSESIVKRTEEVENSNTKLEPSFHANVLPAEILAKIFKRIDTSCSQSIDTARSKEPIITEIKIKDVTFTETKLKQTSFSPVNLQTPIPDKIPKEEAPVKTTIEHNVIDASSCYSKESVRLKALVNLEEVQRKGKAEPSKRHLRESRHHNKNSGDGNSKEVSVRKANALEKTKVGASNRIPRHNQKALQGRGRLRRQMKDTCALQEEVEVSEVELPFSSLAEIKTQTKLEDSPRTCVWESEDEKLRKHLHMGSLTVRRSTSNNRVNLRDELAEATRSHHKGKGACVPMQKNLTKNPPELYHKENDVLPLELQLSGKEIPILNQDSVGVQQDSDMTQSRRPEGSKRFSQRLISTSPEQLRNILTESQLGTCYRMAPIIVGHATTEINPAFKYSNSNNEIVLQFVIPTTIAHTNPTTEVSERGKLEKETSMSGMVPSSQNNPPVESCTSDIKIPISSLQTSTSTMDMVDAGVANDRNNIMLRTLSAPGLLESNWLDPYTLCEMRDCSTNT